ncbi:MAG TPA: amidohydrolase [Synergistaceae bacterium]|jgi:amidohydrolase|nr:amidohydrolase [Synergistaceae bacterium]HQA55271.1 amidohydrolase [Synergistaceae bacterium]
MDEKLFEELYASVCDYIDEHQKTAIDLSDDIARHPELSGKEFRTTGLFRDWLKQEGFDVEMPFCNMETSFKAKIGNGHPRVALLLENDALPVVGHGCGHNLSGTMSAFAGAALSKIMDKVGGELLVICTPAEETWGAKCIMADMGVMDDVDLAMMIHCNPGKNLVSMTTPALESWNITYTGIAAHAAAAPWDGRNAFNGARLFFDALDMMRQHVTPDVRMHGFITECGTVVNTVPDKASIHIELRAQSKPDLDKITERVRLCAAGAAAATETVMTFEKGEVSFASSLELEALEEVVKSGFDRVGLEVAEKERKGGASDVGNISWHCPTIQPLLSIVDDAAVPLHTSEFEAATRSELGHERLVAGTKIIAYTALRFFTDQKLRDRVKAEFLLKRNI